MFYEKNRKIYPISKAWRFSLLLHNFHDARICSYKNYTYVSILYILFIYVKRTGKTIQKEKKKKILLRTSKCKYIKIHSHALLIYRTYTTYFHIYKLYSLYIRKLFYLMERKLYIFIREQKKSRISQSILSRTKCRIKTPPKACDPI